MWFHRKQFIFTGRLFIFYKNLHTSIMLFSFYIDEVVLFSDKSLDFVASNQLGEFYVYLSQIDVSLTIKNIDNTAVMCQVWGEIILQKFRVSILWGVNNKSVSRSGILVSVMMLMQPYKLLMSRLWILSKCRDTISFILRKIEEPDNKIHLFWFGCLCIPRNRSESEFKNRWSVKLRIGNFDQLLFKWWFGILLDYLTYFCDRNWVLCFEQINRVDFLFELERRSLSLVITLIVRRSIWINRTSKRKRANILITVHILIASSRVYPFIKI